MLKNSARKLRRTRSLKSKFFTNEKSKLFTPGPMSVSLPALLKLPDGGATKAWVLKKRFSVRSDFGRIGLPIRFGRESPPPTLAQSQQMNTVKGRPLEKVVMPL